MTVSRNWIDRTRPLWRIGNRLEAWQLRHLGRSPMSLLVRGDVLVLETTGRRTRKRRYAPVAYWQEGNTFLVGGGAAGMATVPDWVRNLRQSPSAFVWIRRARVPVSAEELTGSARDEAQARAETTWPGVAGYEQKSGRVVPYFRLTRLEGSNRTDAA